MENFYKDNPDILFHMNNIDFSQVTKLRESEFVDGGKVPGAPVDLEDAVDNYHRVLDIVGEISGDFIAPRAPEVDKEGATFQDGEVQYAKGTAEAIDRLTKSDLMGFTLPRKYGGINMPKVVYSAAIEMVSRADASLMNLFGLQEIADTIYRFGSDDQKQRILPRFSSGEVTGAMTLTEPDSGSDLQSIVLKATEKDNKWYLNGVKRFITNGCGKISLVMARSEEGTTGGKGISLFIYERDENMKIRRIEHKLGIKGSPTCELQFNNAKAELLGKRKMGLIKYTMSLMNGARLGVSAQAIGIAEAAYREADTYSKERQQFGKRIRNFTAVYEMLTDMKVNIEAGRSLLYETSKIVDIKEGLEEFIEHNPEQAKEMKGELRRYSKFAALFTPLLKSYSTEMANKVCYDGIQIHGGVGFTTEFNAERHYRDVRITNIYEGTTQLQVVAAIGGVIGGVIFDRLDEYEELYDFSAIDDIFQKARNLRTALEESVKFIKDDGDKIFQEYHATRLVNMTADVFNGYLLVIDATKSERKKKVAEIYISKAIGRVELSKNYILSNDRSLIQMHEDIID